MRRDKPYLSKHCVRDMKWKLYVPVIVAQIVQTEKSGFRQQNTDKTKKDYGLLPMTIITFELLHTVFHHFMLHNSTSSAILVFLIAFSSFQSSIKLRAPLRREDRNDSILCMVQKLTIPTIVWRATRRALMSRELPYTKGAKGPGSVREIFGKDFSIYFWGFNNYYERLTQDFLFIR